MILAFAFDLRAENPPYVVIPILESALPESDLRTKAAVKVSAEEDDIGIETIGAEDASLLIGNEAPFGQVLDIAALTWDPETEEITYEYKDDEV